MEYGLGTPMLDCFRRDEVTRDLKILAAQGGVAPRRLEQLGILMLLSSDSDTEISQTAEQTLQNLPTKVVADFIASSDVPGELREFFVKRGINRANTPAPDSDDPL